MHVKNKIKTPKQNVRIAGDSVILVCIDHFVEDVHHNVLDIPIIEDEIDRKALFGILNEHVHQEPEVPS